ncbi:endo-1,4-beta-xylanase 5-like [Telopea speciosissima]|uniref:endo-1,4-beta-xylanase 5-like n=1 Tax=Telopea speciosissima TaxID=54955 RepID=UPI001CC44352|nr:endo-1,4-beta-xylanase 5-like [Telopea speciosissima]
MAIGVFGENYLLLLFCILFTVDVAFHHGGEPLKSLVLCVFSVFRFILQIAILGIAVEALSYDYSATIECLAEPLKPQYGGGIIKNPELNHGLSGWTVFGNAKIEHRSSEKGNSFIVAHSRSKPFDSFSQKLYLLKDKLYTFSAWVQVVKGNEAVTAVFSTNGVMIHAGAVHAESGCWSMLKGGLTVNSSGLAELYFESKNATVEIWVDSVSLQPFTKKQWRSHQDRSIEKVRKRKVRFQAVNADGKTFAGAKISIQQKKASFPFGSAISKEIIDNPAYKSWFIPRFSVTTFENEMKWYSTEPSPGKEDYSVPDAMLAITKQSGISVRGHNILWDDPKFQPNWVQSLSPDQLRQATEKRINSIVTRYKGQVIAWDVVNENLHFSFYEDKLGSNASASFYQMTHQLDGGTTLFMNEYNTIEDSRDGMSTPAKYLEKLREIQSANPGQIGIGLESHFQTPNIPYMRSSLDILAAAKLPIWITELDVESNPSQAQFLEEILREAHAHPAINGIVIWAGWHSEGCNKMCLTDNNFKNLPTGDVVDKLINEWTQRNLVGSIDNNGTFEISLFHGDYDATLTHPSANSNSTRSFKVTTGTSEETMLHVHVHDV